MLRIVIVILLYFTTNVILEDNSNFKLGGIFYDEFVNLGEALELSAKHHGKFQTQVKYVPQYNSLLEISETMCDLFKEKVIGIVDGTTGESSEFIQSICDQFEIPHVVIHQNNIQDLNWTQLNLYPSSVTYNEMIKEVINYKEWRNFTILYVKGHSLRRAEALMKMGNETDKYGVALRELSGNDYRDVLTDARDIGFTNFVVDCPPNRLELLLKHAQQVGIMADEHAYVFLSPDLFTLDLSPYRYGGVNITGFRLVNVNDDVNLENFTKEFNYKNGQLFSPEQIKTEVMLVADAVKVFAEAVKKINVTMEELSCAQPSPWIYGATLLNFMRTNKVEGLTRTLSFDGYGRRIDTIFDIVELTPAGNITIGRWENGKLNLTRPMLSSGTISEESIMRNKTFKVLISTTPPYGYKKQTLEMLTGNDRYEGFTIDLMDKIAQILGFKYELEIELDYGSKVNNKWNGMIAQLMEDRADFAICDFTITTARKSAIDFSMPFMTLGVSILYKEPSKQPPEMFSFMAVFSTNIWIGMLLVQLGLGFLMIFVGRLSNKEWQNPVPCVEQPEELSNQFSFLNSVWLIFASVSQQGAEVAPIAPAPRLITSVWWFFTMVMVASYTGTLVSFLVNESKFMPFENLIELYEYKSINYGCKKIGSTYSFFQDSKDKIRQSMLKRMQGTNGLVDSNEIGVARAESSNYAFFMESASIEYYKERHCDLLQVGGLLDSKSYGIGMKLGSPYKRYIDDALLQLKESGEIQKLRDMWWKEKYGGGKCGDKKQAETKTLEMKNMIGTFVVLGVGCLIGILISILDMLWGVFKRTVKYNTTFRDELIEELKFVIKLSGDIKPVRRIEKQPETESSNEVLTKVEGKDEVRSMRSMRSIRSSDTHRTHHSHSSKHSSRSCSVAFARRRKYT